MPTLVDLVAGALGSRYAIERELGHGGMATVYLATDAKHGRRVALKVLLPEIGASMGAERFLREIQVAARLTHPHILALHDSGESDGLLYYVMPYIAGESLRDRLAREGRLPVTEALQLGREVADALEYAHTHGVIHRDIKPENILLGAGHAIVADFGVARAVSLAGVPDGTVEGGIVGTPTYMSPEQLSGDPDLDGRSDIYSLGCVLFEALVGRPPFLPAMGPAGLLLRLSEAAPPLRSLDPAIPPGLEAVVARALATRAEERFATAAELSSALEWAGRAGSPATYSSIAPAATEASIAVLPFANLSSDPEAEYFSDGMTEEIINALTQVRGLRVAARTSSFTFKGKNVDAREIGEQLRVRTLLEGSVRKAGNRIRLTAQLINAGDGYHVWSHAYERTLSDVFAVQDELARAIATTLTPRVVGDSGGRLVSPSTDNIDAYNWYLKGRHAWTLASLEGFQTAAECFQQAVSLDADYAQAHAWLAYAYAMLGFDEMGVRPALEVMPVVRAEAAKAVALDDTLGDAHFARALVAMFYDWDWSLALEEFERAMDGVSTSSFAQHWYAIFLCAMGKGEQGLQVNQRAQVLDPLSLTVQVSVCRCLHFVGRYQEAVARLRNHLDLHPGSLQGYVSIARSLLALGRRTDALRELERGIQVLGPIPILLCYAAQAHALLGETERAVARLTEMRALAAQRHVPVIYEALVQTALGNLAEAFRLLELAADQRSGWLIFLRQDRGWDPLRADARFTALLRQLRLDA